MSAYLITPDKAIVCAAWALKQHAAEAPRCDWVSDAAIEIWRTNVASICQRYPATAEVFDVKSEAVEFIPSTRHPDLIWWGPGILNEHPVTTGQLVFALELHPLQVHMIAREARYQSCEIDGWEESKGGRYITEALDKSAYEAACRHNNGGGGGWVPDFELVETGRQILTPEARAI
jgi:hypothetical protein